MTNFTALQFTECISHFNYTQKANSCDETKGQRTKLISFFFRDETEPATDEIGYPIFHICLQGTGQSSNQHHYAIQEFAYDLGLGCQCKDGQASSAGALIWPQSNLLSALRYLALQEGSDDYIPHRFSYAELCDFLHSTLQRIM